MALRRSADPRSHERYRVLEAVFPGMRPPVHGEIRVRLELGEFDPAMEFEGMPEVAAAIAHRLHLGLVFLSAGNEFAPIVLEPKPAHEQIVGGRAVVGQLRPFGDPPAQRPENHAPRRHAQPFRIELAEAALAVEGYFQIGVFRYLPGVSRPNAVDESARPGRGEAHLVYPDMPRKRRFLRPFLARVKASVPPKLRSLLVDPEDPRYNPIRAVKEYRRHRLAHRLETDLRRGQRSGRRVARMAPANRAFVSLRAVFPPSVLPQPAMAIRAARVALHGFRGLGFPDARLSPLPQAQFPLYRSGKRCEVLSIK